MSSILLPKILFGTGVSSYKDEDKLYIVIKDAIENGIKGFDTAPSYGTEKYLGRILSRCVNEMDKNREDLFIQTKIDAWQMQDGRIEKYVDSALTDMQLEYFDSLLIHWPIPEYFENTWNSFLRLKEKGKVNHIGICNVRIRHLKNFYNLGIIPEIVQIERNPLFTAMDVIKWCKEHNIGVQAYSPLCKMNEKIKGSTILQDISNKHDRQIGEIVLRWHVDTGVSPIFTSRNSNRIKQYANIFNFNLLQEEITQINSMNINYKLYLESVACPGF